MGRQNYTVCVSYSPLSCCVLQQRTRKRKTNLEGGSVRQYVYTPGSTVFTSHICIPDTNAIRCIVL